MLHHLRLHDTPFKLIQSGAKTLECRINDEKRRSMETHDQIEIASRATGEVLQAHIVERIEAPHFADLFTMIGLEQAGRPARTSIEHAVQDMHQHYTPDEERQYGVVALRLTLS